MTSSEGGLGQFGRVFRSLSLGNESEFVKDSEFVAARLALSGEPAGHFVDYSKISQVLSFACEMCPFYRKRLADIRNLPRGTAKQFFLSMPYLTRRDICQNWLDICSDDIGERRVFRHKTSGTSGEAVLTFLDIRDWHLNLISIANQLTRLGLPVLDPNFGEWSFLQIPSRIRSASAEIQTPLPGSPIWRRLNVRRNSKGFSEDLSITSVRSVLVKSRTVLNSLPEILLQVGRQLRRDIRSHRSQCLLVLSSGEHLSDTMRDEIEELYGAPVYNVYAASEVGTIAFECKQRQGMHIDCERVAVEIGELEGKPEVVVSSLENKAMPILRYRTGDSSIAIEQECKCGDPRPRISSQISRIEQR